MYIQLLNIRKYVPIYIPCSTIQRLLSTQSLQKAHHSALNERTICMELCAEINIGMS